MDWFERLFGLAPDNGDGTLEVSLFLAVSAILLAVAAVRSPHVRQPLLRMFGQVRSVEANQRRD